MSRKIRVIRADVNVIGISTEGVDLIREKCPEAFDHMSVLTLTAQHALPPATLVAVGPDVAKMVLGNLRRKIGQKIAEGMEPKLTWWEFDLVTSPTPPGAIEDIEVPDAALRPVSAETWRVDP